MALTKFTEKLISDSFKASISGSDTTESSSFASRITLVEGGTTSKTLVSSSAQIATDISGSFNSTSSSLASRVTVNEGRVNQGVNTTDSPTFAGGTVTGDFSVGGTLTAQEVHTEFESASILFTSGSTIFGNSSDDVHEFKGNKISGSSTSTASLAMISLADKIEHIGDTNNTIEFGTDEIKLRTGGSSRLIARDSNVELYNDLIVAGDVTIPQKIIHSGDTDNYLSFGTDSLSIYHGGAEKIQFNYGNIYIKTNNQSLVGYNTGGSAKELIKLNDSDLVQIGEASGGDVVITEKLTVGSWDNSNTHGHGNLNISSDANEGADSYLNFAAGTTNKGHIAYDHHATAGSQAMRFVVGDDAVTAMNILGSGYLEIGAAGGNENTYSNSNHAAKVSIDGTWGDPSTGSNSGDTNAIMRIAGSGHSNAIDFGVHSSSPYSGWIQGTNRGTSGGSTGVYGLSLNPLGGSVGIGTNNPGGVLDVFSGSSRLFQVQTDGVGVGNNNPGTYGVLHVSGVGDTSITGSVFYDGYGETGLSGNVVGPHILCLSSTAEASTDTGIQNMGPSMIFRGQPGTGLDGGATFAAIAGTFDASNSNYAAQGNLRFFTSDGYVFNPQYGTELKERMRIDSDGHIYMTSQRDDIGFNQDGLAIGNSNGAFLYLERSEGTSNSILYLHRRNGDGQHISFYESNAQDGYIQTSSGVVSLVGFQGSHEASGIPIDTPTGTVVSTIDEEFKYRHANVKISDTVGDKRVYGVVENFNEEQSDDTGHTHPAHFNIASVGVGHIRVTGSCAGGDLLESNGDGLAKVQDDDIIRSKTIGKVTANVSGSATEDRLVACVLYCG